MMKMITSHRISVLRNKFKNIEKENLTHARTRSKGNEASFDIKQVKKDPPPVVKKRPASISRSDESHSHKSVNVPKVTPKPTMQRRRQSDSLVGYERDSFEEPPDITRDVTPRDLKRNSVGEMYRNSMIDTKDPKMADTSELEDNDPDYGNPCNSCNMCTHGWDLHIWRNMCRNCNCTRADHALSDNNTEKRHRKLNISHSTSKVNELANRVNDGESNTQSLPRKGINFSDENRRSYSMDNILIKDDDVSIETLEMDRAQSQFNFSELDHMIDELDLLIEAKVADEMEDQNRHEKTKNLEDREKVDGKLYEQIKRKIISMCDEVQPPAKQLQKQQTIEEVSSDASSTTDNNVADEITQIDKRIDKVESEEVVQDKSPSDGEVQKEICHEDAEQADENSKENSVENSEMFTNYGLKDLELQLMQMMELGDIDIYSSDEDSPSESEEEMHRRAFIRQIPPNDFLILRHLEELDKYELKEKELFLIHLHQKAIGKGRYIEANKIKEPGDCSFCKQTILQSEPFKFIERQHGLAYHMECFVCCQCEQALVDDIYFNQGDNIYCGRHYSEIYKSRCIECDELIFSEKFAVAEDECWHLKHFCCSLCDSQLGGERYVIENMRPHCLACYHETLADKCEACKQTIRIGTEWMNFQNRNWHACSSCFCCSNCNRDLCDIPFVPVADNILCSTECAKAYI